MSTIEKFLEPCTCVNSDHPSVIALAETLTDCSEFVDIPLAEMLAVFAEHYPEMMLDAGDWGDDGAAEVEIMKK